MSFQQELNSWFAPPQLNLLPAPQPGEKAPSSEKLALPCSDGKPAVVAFLRHCGCPFAERDFIALRSTAEAHPNVHFIAVSHSGQEHTSKWLSDVGGEGKTSVVVDDTRQLYAQWGLGVSGWLHILSPFALWNLVLLGWNEGIKNRPTETGYRWQTGGNWAVDGEGYVKWGAPAARGDEKPDYDKAARTVEKGDARL